MIEIRKANLFPKALLPPAKALPDVRYIPSRYALTAKHGGRAYVFHNLTKQCIEGTLPAAARGGEGYDELIEARFLVPEDLDECAAYERAAALMRSYHPEKGMRSYSILPTLGCNARCVYCYEEGLEQTAMSPETADEVIRCILGTCSREKLSLGWFGGEPLLGEKIIDRICEGLRDAGINFTSNMVTNGSLITPALIRKMTGSWNLTKIQVSVDGAEPDYVARKRYAAYHDDYHRVMESVNELSAAGIKVKVHCNVDEENWSGVPRFLRDLSEAVVHKQNVFVHFFPLFDVRHGENDLAMWKKILEARPLIEDKGFPYTPVMGDALLFRPYRCSAVAGSPCIWPDGGLSVCPSLGLKDRYGDIRHGVTDESVRKEYTRMDRTREKCRLCPYLPNCTPYEHCPGENTHCREVNDLLMKEFVEMLAAGTFRAD